MPVDHGGLWRSFTESAPVVIDAVRGLARGDQSVGLVAAMHPGVMMLWTGLDHAPEPFTDLWADQRSRVFRSTVDGGFWGTLTSEPGSGGDLAKTKATVEPIPDDPGRFSLQGQKHFGSGSEVASYMITTAKPTAPTLRSDS